MKQVSSILTMPRLATSPQLKQRSSSPGQGSAVCGAPITAGMFVPKLPVNTEGLSFMFMTLTGHFQPASF